MELLKTAFKKIQSIANWKSINSTVFLKTKEVYSLYDYNEESMLFI